MGRFGDNFLSFLLMSWRWSTAIGLKIASTGLNISIIQLNVRDPGQRVPCFGLHVTFPGLIVAVMRIKVALRRIKIALIILAIASSIGRRRDTIMLVAGLIVASTTWGLPIIHGRWRLTTHERSLLIILQIRAAPSNLRLVG
jgi:hypothetical protein